MHTSCLEVNMCVFFLLLLQPPIDVTRIKWNNAHRYLALTTANRKKKKILIKRTIKTDAHQTLQHRKSMTEIPN